MAEASWRGLSGLGRGGGRVNNGILSEAGLQGYEAGSGPIGKGDDGGPEVALRDDVWLHKFLHDLAQPLTALECLLYVHRDPVAGESMDAALLRLVMEEGLVECGRMMALVRAMQQRMAGTSGS